MYVCSYLYNKILTDIHRWGPYTAQELYYVKHAYTTDKLLEDREFFGSMNSPLTTEGVAYIKNVSCYCGAFNFRQIMRKYPEGYPPENAARKDDMIEIDYDFLIQCGGLYKFYVDPQTADKASIHTILTRAAEEFQWYETPLQYLDKKSYKLTASLFGVEYLSNVAQRIHTKVDEWLQRVHGVRPGLAKSA